ncbi:MAG TPA: hypothetical protein VJ464_08825 [Blastocatellia bacterium]|nr:hypothetical protein [Blastocatellia bacterium]
MKMLSGLMMVMLGLGTSFSGAAQTSSSPATAAAGPARKVKGQVLTSPATPAVRLEFGKDFKYVGHQEFILYDVAHAEQHFFVDADKDGRIKRFYWVQFEGYLPGNTHTYRYKSNQTVDIGGLAFFADAAARNMKINVSRPDSDGSRARAFLESKGYRMASDEMLWQRLVHLVDESRRDELMIIYMEDLTPTGLRASDLWRGGRAESQWDDMAKALLDRAVKSLKLRR